MGQLHIPNRFCGTLSFLLNFPLPSKTYDRFNFDFPFVDASDFFLLWMSLCVIRFKLWPDVCICINFLPYTGERGWKEREHKEIGDQEAGSDIGKNTDNKEMEGVIEWLGWRSSKYDWWSLAELANWGWGGYGFFLPILFHVYIRHNTHIYYTLPICYENNRKAKRHMTQYKNENGEINYMQTRIQSDTGRQTASDKQWKHVNVILLLRTQQLRHLCNALIFVLLFLKTRNCFLKSLFTALEKLRIYRENTECVPCADFSH